MANFISFDPRGGESKTLDFDAFIEIAKGATVRSCAAGDDFVELGLAEKINIRFQSEPNGEMSVILMSTLNDGEIPPLRIRIIEEDELVSAALVESRIHALRQSYAIALMVRNDRSDELLKAIEHNPHSDFEAIFLSDDERLYIAAAAPGSFWITVITKSKLSYQTLKHSLALAYEDGRGALLRRVEAETMLRELAVEDKQLEIGLKRANGAIDTISRIEKIKDAETREAIKSAFIGSLDDLGAKNVLALPSPDPKQKKSRK